MNKRFFLATAIVTALSGYWIYAYAAQAPAGPYQKSCNKCSVNGKMGPAGKLFCTCKRADRSDNQTSLLLQANSSTPINNCNGNLQYGPCR